MNNPFRDHFERESAAKKARQANADPRLSAQVRRQMALNPRGVTLPEVPSHTDNENDTRPPADNMELKFYSDFQRIKSIQSIEQRVVEKKAVITEYLPWAEGVINGGATEQNDMLVYLMLWALDTHEFEHAVAIAEFAMLADMVMPDGMKRSVAATFAEQFAQEMLAQDELGVHADLIAQVVDLTNDYDMVDQIRAKLIKAQGFSVRERDPATALSLLERADTLDKGAHVKTEINKLKKVVASAEKSKTQDNGSAASTAS